MLYREPKLLKEEEAFVQKTHAHAVSVLYREPKLLKAASVCRLAQHSRSFSALP